MPLINPTTCDTAYFGGIAIIMCYRRKALYGQLRRHLGEVFRKLAAEKESRIEEGHLMPDHVKTKVKNMCESSSWLGLLAITNGKQVSKRPCANTHRGTSVAFDCFY